MKKIVFLSILLLFNACSLKQPQKSGSVVVVMKTPTLKFQGSGFLRMKGSQLELELYYLAKPLIKFKLSNRVCIDDGCFSYESFYKKFFHTSYPKKLLLHIFKREPIFDGVALKRQKSGFIQRIVQKDFDIIYQVDLKKSTFKDRKNHILIKIKELNE